MTSSMRASSFSRWSGSLGQNMAAMGRSLRLTALVSWLIVVLGALPQPVAEHVLHRTPLTPGLSLVLVAEVLFLVALLRGWFTRAMLVVTAAPLATGVLWMLPHRSLVDPVNMWAPGYWAVPWVLLAILVLPRAGYVAATCAISLPLLVLDPLVQWWVGAPLTPETIQPIPVHVWAPMTLLLFCDGLVELARHSDEVLARREASVREKDLEGAYLEAGREAARVVHDHVLHALHGLSNGLGAAPDELVLQDCRSAVEALGPRVQQADDTRLEDLVASDPTLEQVGGILRGHTPEMPGPVAHAMADATHEALTNVQRHAGECHCTVAVRHLDDTWTCNISDTGVGFDPDAVDPARLGLRSSLRGRMSDVGGAASITSRPGVGTTVVLSWPVVDEPAAPPPDFIQREARRALTRSAIPNLVLTPFYTALGHRLVEPAWPSWLACAVLVLVGFHYVRVINRRPLRLADSLLLLGTAMAIWATNLWIAPDDPSGANVLWLAWGGASLAHLVVLQARVAQGIAWLVAWIAGMAGLAMVRFGADFDWVRLHAVVTAGVGEAIVCLVAYHAGRQIAARGLEDHHLQQVADYEVQRLRVRNHLEEHWSRRVTGEALPLLAAVAEGRRSLTDPTLPREARAIESSLRDELVLGPQSAQLLGGQASLRRNGWTVQSALDPESEEVLGGLVAQLSKQLGPAAFPGQVVTLSQCTDSLTVVVLDGSPTQRARWRTVFGEVLDDEDFTRIRLSQS